MYQSPIAAFSLDACDECRSRRAVPSSHAASFLYLFGHRDGRAVADIDQVNQAIDADGSRENRPLHVYVDGYVPIMDWIGSYHQKLASKEHEVRIANAGR